MNGSNKLECLSQANLSSLMNCKTSLAGTFLSYKETEVSWIQTQEPTFWYGRQKSSPVWQALAELVFKTGVHYCDYRSKLVHFEVKNIYFLCLKNPSLELFPP